jgi:hypothetical protein
MTKTPPILRNSALSIPLGVVAGAFMSWPDAASALVSSLVVIGNLWVLSVLSPRALEALARSAEGESGADVGLWMGAIAAKFVLLLLLYLAMLQFLPPFGLAMGFVPMLVGVLVTGIQLALEESKKQDREE